MKSEKSECLNQKTGENDESMDVDVLETNDFKEESETNTNSTEQIDNFKLKSNVNENSPQVQNIVSEKKNGENISHSEDINGDVTDFVDKSPDEGTNLQNTASTLSTSEKAKDSEKVTENCKNEISNQGDSEEEVGRRFELYIH